MSLLPHQTAAILTRLHLLVSGSLLATAAAAALILCLESQRQRGSAFPVVLPSRDEFQPYPVPKPGEGGAPDARPNPAFCLLIGQEAALRAQRNEQGKVWALVASLLLLGVGIPAHHIGLRSARRRLMARLGGNLDAPPAQSEYGMFQRRDDPAP